MIALLALSASAQDTCVTIYTETELVTALDEVDRLIGNSDIKRATNVLRKTKDLIPCTDRFVKQEHLARFGRGMALTSFYGQELEAAIAWGRMFTYTDVGNGWDLPENHPVRKTVTEAGDPPLVGPKDKGLLVPDKGAMFLNGALAVRPEARDEVPYLVQIFNANGYPIKAFWQDGGAFPDSVLGPPGDLKYPKWYDPINRTVTPRGDPPTPGQEEKPPSDFPIAQTAVAGGLVLASGVMYALAGGAKARVTCDARTQEGCPTTPEELTAARSRANLLTIGAGVVFAAGVGVGVTGLLTDGEPPGIVISGRF